MISWIIRITKLKRASQRGIWQHRFSHTFHDGTNFNTFFSGSARPWSVSKLPSPAPLEKSQLETAGDDVWSHEQHLLQASVRCAYASCLRRGSSCHH